MTTITEYNPFAPAVKENPYPYYAWLRKEHPVYCNSALDIWALSRYEDVRAALLNKEVFSSAQGIGPERITIPTMIMSDPPQHTRLRSLVNKAFTPRMVARMEGRIREILRHLLEAAIDRGSFDLVRDVAEPLPVIVISEMLGVDAAHRAAFKRWSDDTIGVLGGSPEFDFNRYLASWNEFKEYFSAMIEERRKSPRDDLVSALVTAQEERDVLTRSEILNFNLLLLVAGNETTTNLITNGALALLEHRDDAAQLRERPGLIPSAVEECLRYDSPIQATFRTTTQDVTVKGVTIPRDSKVMMLYGSANRDEDVFDEPDRFKIDREPNDHIAFAIGIHYCLGAPLARLEGRLALEEILAQMRNIRLDPSGERARVDNPLFRGLKKLPLLFDRP